MIPSNDVLMAMLRRNTDEDLRARAEVYVLQGRVQDITLRGDLVMVDVDGRGGVYRVTARIGEDRLRDVTCDCPFEGDWCKHVAATVLTMCRVGVRERPAPGDLLAGRDRAALADLVEYLMERDPDLVQVVETRLRTEGRVRKAAPEAEPADADPRRRIDKALEDLQDADEDAWEERLKDVARVFQGILSQARAFAEAGDGDKAVVLLEPLTEAFLEHEEALEYGATRDLPWDLNEAWTEALLSCDLPARRRQAWAERWDAWQRRGWGDEEPEWEARVFDTSIQVARHGWAAPDLQETPPPEDEDPEWEPENDLARIALDLLRRQGRRDEAMSLARRTRRVGEVVALLAEDGRTEESLAYGLERLTGQTQAWLGATALWAQGARAEAIRLARHGLGTMGQGDGRLAPWLRDAALEEGDAEAAAEAVAALFRGRLRLEDFLLARSLAGERWPDHRDRLLEHVRRVRHNHGDRVAVLLAEGLTEEAMAMADQTGSQDALEAVVESVATSHPEWTIRATQAQVEAIVGHGRRDYENTLWWLEKCRDAHLAAGREAAWHGYLEGLIQQHRRKRRLRALLEALR